MKKNLFNNRQLIIYKTQIINLLYMRTSIVLLKNQVKKMESLTN